MGFVRGAASIKHCPSGHNREASVPMQSTGSDRLVGAMKARNGAGAKGSGQAVV